MNNEKDMLMEQENPAMTISNETAMENIPAPSPDLTDYSELPSPLIGEDGNFVPEWYSRFEELAEAQKTLAKFKRPEALAKSYAELEKMRGYPDVSDSGRMAAFRDLVGLPGSPENFHLERPESVSEEFWNESLAGEMAKVAYEYGVPAPAMNALAEAYAHRYESHLAELESSKEAEMRETEEELRRDWGDDFDRARTQAVSAARMLADKAGLTPDDIVNDPELASNASFIKMMRAVSLMMEESPLRRGEAHHLRPGDEAKRIESDPSHPLHDAYMKPSHPNHRYANEVYDRLAFGMK